MNTKHTETYQKLSDLPMLGSICIGDVKPRKASHIASRAGELHQKQFITRKYDGAFHIINVTKYPFKVKVIHTK